MLLVVVLALFPFFVGVLAFVLVCLRDNLSLFEQGDGWANSFLQVFLVDFSPMGISSLLADPNPFKNLLLVGFERGKIIWGEHIGWAMKTRQLHELADDFDKIVDEVKEDVGKDK